MANPLDAFKNLKPWQQAAIVIGSAGAIGVVVWQKEKAKKAVPVTPATATQAATSGTAGEIEDPTTGQYYPDTSVDPETGLTYQQEITEYGSVSAADAATSGIDDQATLQGETPEEYDEQIGGTPLGTTSTVTTNAQWTAEVQTGLSEQGYSASDIGQALAAYFSSTPLGTSSDGTSLYTIMNLAVSEYGPPPTGSYPLLMGSTTSTGTGTSSSTGTSSTGTTSTGTTSGTGTSSGTGSASTGTTSTGTTSATGTSSGTGSTTTKSTATPETAPINVKASTSGAVTTISWQAVGAVNGYEYELAEPSGELYRSGSVTVPSGSFDNLVDIAKGTWHFKCRAFNAAGFGPWSAVIAFTP